MYICEKLAQGCYVTAVVVFLSFGRLDHYNHHATQLGSKL